MGDESSEQGKPQGDPPFVTPKSNSVTATDKNKVEGPVAGRTPPAINVTADSYNVEKKTNGDHRHWQDHGTFWILVVGLLLAIGGGWYAKRAAEGTWAQVDAMRQSTKAELRAYVLAKRYPFVNTVIASGGTHTRVNYRNSGQTPASNVTIRVSIKFGARSPEVAPNVFSRGRIIVRGQTIDPKDEINIGPILRFKGKLTDDTIKAIRNKSQSIYIWGVISYDDIFGEERHRSYFCFIYNGIGTDPYGPAGRERESAPYRGNCPTPKSQ